MNKKDEKQLRAVLTRASTIEEIRKIDHIVKERWNAIQARGCAQFKPGDRVSFQSRMGFKVIAIVDKVNRKSVNVHVADAPFRTYRISPSLLIAEA